ncbi:cyclic lactone autoinducer peptide [Staphylococcus xylosus]|nr:cyclic lactone autoinducer peptide [Staphylococcus xylosus]RIM75235.1 cyclic lactone autoinducer peptide [Staphylococcus xylosus]
MNIFTSILTIFVKFFSFIGTISSVRPCGGFVDEPEVPKELTKLYE